MKNCTDNGPCRNKYLIEEQTAEIKRLQRGVDDRDRLVVTLANKEDRLCTIIGSLVRREWIGHTGSGGQACPFCHGFYPDHKTDCVRQAAIAEVEGC